MSETEHVTVLSICVKCFTKTKIFFFFSKERRARSHWAHCTCGICAKVASTLSDVVNDSLKQNLRTENECLPCQSVCPGRQSDEGRLNEEQKETSLRGGRLSWNRQHRGIGAKVEGSVSARQTGKEEARNTAKGRKGERGREEDTRATRQTDKDGRWNGDKAVGQREDRAERNKNERWEREREREFAERQMSRCESSNTEGKTRAGTKWGNTRWWRKIAHSTLSDAKVFWTYGSHRASFATWPVEFKLHAAGTYFASSLLTLLAVAPHFVFIFPPLLSLLSR